MYQSIDPNICSGTLRVFVEDLGQCLDLLFRFCLEVSERGFVGIDVDGWLDVWCECGSGGCSKVLSHHYLRYRLKMIVGF